MKKIILISTLLLFVFSFKETSADLIRVNINNFYSELSFHGEWIQYENNVKVWRPLGVNLNWRPYYYGSWVWTDDGWYWDSDEDFGWAVYHYGRWQYDDFYGWVWFPGKVWAPAWVEWRYNNDYLGWAPLPRHASFDVAIGIHFSNNWITSHQHWNFVKYNRFFHKNVHAYVVKNSNNFRIFKKTKHRTNYYAVNGKVVNRGVNRTLVERKSGISIKTRKINRIDNFNEYKKVRKSNDRSVTIYRPSKKTIATKDNTNSRSIKSISKSNEKSNRTNIKRNVEKKSLSNRGEFQQKSSRNNNSISRDKIDKSKSRSISRSTREGNNKSNSKQVKSNKSTKKSR